MSNAAEKQILFMAEGNLKTNEKRRDSKTIIIRVWNVNNFKAQVTQDCCYVVPKLRPFLKNAPTTVLFWAQKAVAPIINCTHCAACVLLFYDLFSFLLCSLKIPMFVLTRKYLGIFEARCSSSSFSQNWQYKLHTNPFGRSDKSCDR